MGRASESSCLLRAVVVAAMTRVLPCGFAYAQRTLQPPGVCRVVRGRFHSSLKSMVGAAVVRGGEWQPESCLPPAELLIVVWRRFLCRVEAALCVTSAL